MVTHWESGLDTPDAFPQFRRYPFTVTDQCSLCSRLAPDSETQSRASATMTDCGPAPAAPATSTVFPSADSLPAQDPSGWLVRDTCVPGGRSLSASDFGSDAARCCSSFSLATQSAQRVFWNLA